MQQAVNLMRAAGYEGVISIPCIDYANQCAGYGGSSWWQTHPADRKAIWWPRPASMATTSVARRTTARAYRLNTVIWPNMRGIGGRRARTGRPPTATGANMQVLLPWADTHISGYMAWTWDTWGGNCGSLISNYNGTPAAGYGAYIHSHFAALASAG